MEKLPSVKVEDNQSYFTIDWPDLKEMVSDLLFKGGTPLLSGQNLSGAKSNTAGVSSWNGYSANDLKSWIRNGFRTDQSGIEIQPPVREKRRYIYSEDASEMHIDRVLSGEDNYAGEFTKRVIIPGVSILVNVDFSSGVSARVVNEYNVFVCQCIQSLEAAGIDSEITMDHTAQGLIPGVGLAHTIVRIKRENEASDFGSFSPMISPAAFRSLMFTAMYAHAESMKKTANYGLGTGRYHHNPNHRWDVTRDEKTQVIVFDCPRSPHEFPKAEMELKFRDVLGVRD